MHHEEYVRYDGLGLADLVRRKEVSPSELLDAALARAASVNPRLNAIVISMNEIAERHAHQPLEGPFAGVPFLLKDLGQAYAGVPNTCGCAALRDAGPRPTLHDEIVARWLAAGVVVFGRTNTPEFGAKAITEPLAWGPARNPWQLDRTPGGSSGGSASAVAAGIVPLAGASDGGGSIRIPSAYCGLFGFKPGRARTPSGPDVGESMHGASVAHVITRSVRDSAAMLDATHGPERASLFHLAPPAHTYFEALAQTPGRLRIGFATHSPIDAEVHPEAIRAVNDTATLLASLGHHVEPAEPAIDGMQLANDFLTIWFSTHAWLVEQARAVTGGGWRGFESDTRLLAAMGRAIRGNEYVAAYERINRAARLLAEYFEYHDIFLTPSVAYPAPRIGEVATPIWQALALHVLIALGQSRAALRSGAVHRVALDNLKWVPYTQLANLAGVPSMSVPLHWTPDGLPLGLLFTGPVGSEERLFSLAAQLEAARPWFHRLPVL